jgi:hypothetical protein
MQHLRSSHHYRSLLRTPAQQATAASNATATATATTAATAHSRETALLSLTAAAHSVTLTGLEDKLVAAALTKLHAPLFVPQDAALFATLAAQAGTRGDARAELGEPLRKLLLNFGVIHRVTDLLWRKFGGCSNATGSNSSSMSYDLFFDVLRKFIMSMMRGEMLGFSAVPGNIPECRSAICSQERSQECSKGGNEVRGAVAVMA